MAPQRQMHLNLFIQGVGHHEAAWRHPETDPLDMMDIGYYQRLARQAEDAKLDSVFIADGLAINQNIEFGPFNNFFEPFTLLAAIAAATERIGVIGTASTTYSDPYTLARLVASLDLVSKGRAGWNIVTSANQDAAHNYGRDQHMAHEQRYVRANEFLEVTTALWDCWEDDALLADREAGRFVDRSKIHAIDHRGDLLSVRGPIDIPRSLQGQPVRVQAGSSNDGRELAGRFAEAIYTAAVRLEDAQEFYRDVKSRMASYGRAAHECAILPGLAPIVGRTHDEALERQARLNEYVIPEYTLNVLSRTWGTDLSQYSLDDAPPPLPPVEQLNGGRSRAEIYASMAKRENLSLRQLIERTAFGRGHDTFVGTPEEIADHMEEWFTQEACDGFNLLMPLLPTDFTQFIELVLPELRRRGLFRTEYTGTTLRSHLGLDIPANRFATALV